MIPSVLEAVLGSSLTRPIYAKDEAPKTPAMEMAGVLVNNGVAFVSVMAIPSTWLFGTVAVLGVKVDVCWSPGFGPEDPCDPCVSLDRLSIVPPISPCPRQD